MFKENSIFRNFDVMWKDEVVARVRDFQIEMLDWDMLKNPLIRGVTGVEKLEVFLEDRRITLDRDKRYKCFSSPDVCGDIEKELWETKGKSYDDSVWLRFEGCKDDCWDTVNPRKNPYDVEERNTSLRGNQEKWIGYDGYWYKRDMFGGEAVTEHIVTCFLKSINFYYIVDYYLTDSINVCKSDTFSYGDEILTFDWMLKRLYNNKEYKDILNRPFHEKNIDENIDFIVGVIKNFGEIDNNYIKEYLKALFYIDALVCNEDRHFNNFGVIKSSFDGCISLIPSFDFGLSLGVYHDFTQKEKKKDTTAEDLKKGILLDPFDYDSNQVKKFLQNQIDLKMNLDVFFIYLDKRMLNSRRLNIFKQLIFTELSEKDKSLFQKRLDEERNKYNGEL